MLPSCAGNVPTPSLTSDADAIATIVAGTLSAIQSATPSPEPTATSTSELSYVLPRSLYYSAKDSNGKYQIYRLDRDGVTITQITFEQNDLRSFDISPTDGTIIYSTSDNTTGDNQLIAIDANSANRRVLVEAPTSEFFGTPVWSPNGQTLVFSQGNDLYLYSFSTGKSALLLAGSAAYYFTPELFSPDGRKLIVRNHPTPGAPEGAFPEIYDFASNIIIRISEWEGYPYPPTCLGNMTWITQDSFFCFYHSDGGMPMPGLLGVNANDGSIKILMVSKSPFQLVAAPHQDSAGNLIYLYGEHDGVYAQGKPYPTLSLVHSDADGITNRVMLRPETFRVRVAFWSPDERAIVILQCDELGRPSELSLVPVDPSMPVVTLLSDASSVSDTFRWGP